MLGAEFCREFYVVEESIEVVVDIGGETERIRIDALRNQAGTYSTKSYIQQELNVKFTHASPRRQNTGSVRIWTDYDLPWTHRQSADDALSQALGFLQERVG